MPPASRSERPDGLADLSWRPPPILTGRSLWQHDVRRLVGGYRVSVPQLETIVRGGAPAVVGVATEDHWELRARRRADRVTPLVNIDDRMRVVVPQGVRHRLGLIDDVVVSVNPGLGVVRIWSTRCLDRLMGAGT